MKDLIDKENLYEFQDKKYTKDDIINFVKKF